MSKLSDVVKKFVYDKLAAKVNNIDSSTFVLKTKYQTGKTELENKIPDLTDFDKETKLIELENKIPDVSGSATKPALTAVENKILHVSNLATKTALTTVENKIPNINGLVKKTDIIQKSVKLKERLLIIIMTNILLPPEFNTLAADVFHVKVTRENLLTKTDFDTKVSSVDSKIAANNSKNESIENKLKKGMILPFLLQELYISMQKMVFRLI